MSASMYNNSIPMFIRGLNNLSAILDKAAKWAEGKKIDQAVLVNLRLAPDMFPLSRQVQIATDGVKGFAARISGTEIPSYEDKENNIAELQARIAKTVKFLGTFKAEQIDGTEKKNIEFKIGGNDRKFTGIDYLNNFVVPNFYFHVTTTYAILRANGLDIGKGDYLGNLQAA